MHFNQIHTTDRAFCLLFFYIFVRKIIRTNTSPKVLCLGFLKSEKEYIYNPHNAETLLKKIYLSEHLMIVAWKQSLRDVLQYISLAHPMRCLSQKTLFS